MNVGQNLAQINKDNNGVYTLTRKSPVYTIDQDHPLDSILVTDDQRLLADLRQCLHDNRAEEGIVKIRSRLTEPLPDEPNAKTTLVGSL
jgi:hypothetical protein